VGGFFFDSELFRTASMLRAGDVVSKLIEGVYDSLEPLKKDVSRVFANAIKYYGPDGAGRRLHEPSDCDDYVQRAQRFDDAWTSVAKTLKNPGREVKSPTPKKDVNLAALRCLDKLRDHRESDGRGGSYQVATPFLHANMLPTHSEYLPCIGGLDTASLAFFESRRRRRGGRHRSATNASDVTSHRPQELQGLRQYRKSRQAPGLLFTRGVCQ
jgi:hypothetical protein